MQDSQLKGNILGKTGTWYRLTFGLALEKMNMVLVMMSPCPKS